MTRAKWLIGLVAWLLIMMMFAAIMMAFTAIWMASWQWGATSIVVFILGLMGFVAVGLVAEDQF